MPIAGIVAAVGTAAAVGTGVGIAAELIPPIIEAGTEHSSRRGVQNVKVNFGPGLAPLESRSTQHPCGKAPFGNPQYNWDNCCHDLKGKRLKGTLNGKTLKMTGVPLSCISVASWYNTGNSEGTIPYACGDHCLEWKDITNAELQQIRAWVNGPKS